MKMSDSVFIPFFHWSECKSSDEKNPDVIRLHIVDGEPDDTMYSTNIDGIIENKGLHKIPLHNFDTANKALLVQYTKLWKTQKIKNGDDIIIAAYMGVSSKDKTRKLRRWKISSTS